MIVESQPIVSSHPTAYQESDWKYSDRFSGDDLIEAYLHGKKEGVAEATEGFKDALVAKRNNSIANANQVLQHLRKMELHPVRAFMQVESFVCFNVIITIPLEEYISDIATHAYEYMIDFTASLNGENYILNFSLMDEGDDINEDLLEADGFTIRYGTAPKDGTVFKKQ